MFRSKNKSFTQTIIAAFALLLLSACGQSSPALQNPDDVVYDDNEVPSDMEVSDARIDLLRGSWLIKPSETIAFDSGSLVISAVSRQITLIELHRISNSQGSFQCLISKRGEVIDTQNLLTGDELVQKKNQNPQFRPRLRIRFHNANSLTQNPDCLQTAAEIDSEIKAEIDHEKNIFAITNESNEVVLLRLEDKEYFYQP